MGIVYAARHDLLGQRVAIKFLLSRGRGYDDAVARFLNEARAAARIDSDHIARVLDVGTLDGESPYMVLEFLDGSDLSGVLKERGPLPVTEAVDHLLQAIEALAHAHALGIVHRDLKPSNLFLARRQDGTRRVKVLDFGISKVIDVHGTGGSGAITKTNAMLGSPLYMSPEQLRDAKSVDHRCDIWALGVIAYEVLTGKPPFMADNAVALFAAIQESEPASLRSLRPDIPPEVEAIVLCCLRRTPADRFSSVTELGAALLQFGGVDAARAFENAARILPAAQHAPVRPQTDVGRGRPLGSAPAVASANQVQTANPWATSARQAAPKKAPVVAIAVLAAGGLLALTIAIFGTRAFLAHRLATSPAASAALAPSNDIAPPAPVASTGAPAPEPPPIATAIVTVTAVADSLANAASAPPPPVIQAHVPARPVSTSAPGPAGPKVTPPAPAPSGAARPRSNCSPPYEFDGEGKKHWKPECL
jgi:serine/threonine-protein kinase